MSAHRARAERLLADLDAMDDTSTSQALVTVVMALAESNLALEKAQERLADALNQRTGGDPR